MQTVQEHVLDGEVSLTQASPGKRFGNYLIDLVSFYALLFLVGIIIGLFKPELLDLLDDQSPGKILDRLISLLLYGLYLGAVEAVFNGRTLGKVITGTVALNQDGTRISTGTAFKRGFSRAVPFCAFSALGTPCFPWQDKWTDTYVVDVKTSVLPREEDQL
jgi:uncharacterized RDD family membrane protein YckC